jgi:hypothetical protein
MTCMDAAGEAVRADWTADPATGRTNSSEEYLRIVGEVERLIRESAHALINGGVWRTAALIVAQLAHVHHLAPAGAPVTGRAGEGAVTGMHVTSFPAPAEPGTYMLEVDGAGRVTGVRRTGG